MVFKMEVLNKDDCATMVDEQSTACVAPAEESLDQRLNNQQNYVCRNSKEPDPILDYRMLITE